MQTKTLDFGCKVKADDAGTFEAYGSVFGVKDNVGDVVEPGAFTKSLEKKSPALLWQHDAHQPIGVYTAVKEDEHGLHCKGQLALSTQKGREAHELMKMGAVTGFSIGYRPINESFDKDAGVNRVREVDLWEVSLVTFPCNEAAQLSAVKAALVEDRLPTIKEFERHLREAGFSKQQALTIASSGYRALLRESEDAEQDWANNPLIQFLRT